jgi:hypothetical protein
VENCGFRLVRVIGRLPPEGQLQPVSSHSEHIAGYDSFNLDAGCSLAWLLRLGRK